MNHTQFKESNLLLGKPSSMTDEECGSLHVHHDKNSRPPQYISCWTGSWKERLRFLFTGKIWLGVLSYESQPPVYLTIDNPFEE